MAGDGFLESTKISPATAKLYWGELVDFENFCHRKGLPLGSAANEDAALVRYLDALFFGGGGIDIGRRAPYSYNHFRSKVHKPLQRFPRAAKSLKSWEKKDPPRSRLGLPIEMIYMLASQLIRDGHPRLAAPMLIHCEIVLDAAQPVGREDGRWWRLLPPNRSSVRPPDPMTAPPPAHRRTRRRRDA